MVSRKTLLKSSFVTFFKHILVEFLFGTDYLVNLKLFAACTRFLTHSFYVNASQESVVVSVSKIRKRSFNFVITFVLVWSSIFCIRVGFRVFGIGSDSGADSYKMSQKLIDIGWLTLLACNVVFKFEMYRKEDEICLLVNTASFLEQKAIARGKNSNSGALCKIHIFKCL
jgi:hypothetical protein